jgi:hypothetical protein
MLEPPLSPLEPESSPADGRENSSDIVPAVSPPATPLYLPLIGGLERSSAGSFPPSNLRPFHPDERENSSDIVPGGLAACYTPLPAGGKRRGPPEARTAPHEHLRYCEGGGGRRGGVWRRDRKGIVVKRAPEAL